MKLNFRDVCASGAAAFSLYSRVPMPALAWTERTAALTLAFFPLVGLAEGFLTAAALLFLRWLRAGDLLIGAAGVLVPVLFNGGIHLDGFCDVCDALGSHQPTERKLEILKDSRCGAFALIGCVCLLLTRAAATAELAASPRTAACFCGGFILSRCLSAAAVLTFPSARSGTASALAQSAWREGSFKILAVLGLVPLAAMVLLDVSAAAVMASAAAVSFLYYRSMAKREFGGVTGDLAGWFLEVCECAMALAAAVVVMVR